jgi:hypothetical protein
VGRPPIGAQAMTGAERLRRHRALHGREPDPTNAARQQRWRDRQAAKRAAEEANRALEPAAPDLLLAQAVAILKERGEVDLLRKLRANWPYIELAARQQMAAGTGFRFWLRDG